MGLDPDVSIKIIFGADWRHEKVLDTFLCEK